MLSTAPTQSPRSPGARRRLAPAFAVALLALLLLALAPAAGARTIVGGSAAETLTGTAGADRILGRGGDDSLLGKKGADRLVGGPGNDSLDGGPGRDALLGGPGADRIDARDGFADTVDCGPGHDVAIVDELDTVAANCEVVKRPAPESAPTLAPTSGPVPEPGGGTTTVTTPPAGEGSAPTAPPAEVQGPVLPGGETNPPEQETSPPERPPEEPPREAIPTYEENPIATFPAGHGWTGNQFGTYEDAGPPFVVNGDRSLKIETDGLGDESVASSPQLPEINLSGSHVAVQGLVSYSAYLGQVRLRLSSGDPATEYAEATVWEETEDPTVLGSTFETQSIPLGAFKTVGKVNWAKIDHAQLVLTDNQLGKVIFYAAGIYAVPTYKTPTLSFAFDDSLASTYTLGLKELSNYRFPATEYVIADTIGTPGFLTEEQLYTMRNLDHWEIGGHAAKAADHNAPNGLDSLTPAELKADFDEMREWMGEHGFAQRTFAYPKGAAGQEVRKYAQRDYCAARVTAKGPETIPPRNPFTIRGFSIDSSTTHVAQVEAEIEKAVAEKSWMVLTFHNLVTGAPVETTDFNYAEFIQIVEFVHSLTVAHRLQVRTVADAVGC